MFCRKQVACIESILDELNQLGVSVIGVGSGNIHQAKDFVAVFGVKFPIYTDPTLKSFDAFKLKRKFGINFTAIARYLKAFREGFRQGRTQGHPWQQGGIVLVHRSGNIAWSHINNGPGDQSTASIVLSNAKQVLD